MNPEILTVQPRLRVYTIHIVAILIVATYLLYFATKIPPQDFNLSRIIINFFSIENEWIKTKILSVFKYKISHLVVKKAILIKVAILLSFIGYYWLKVKTTAITLTNKYMEINEGILSRTQDNLDMIDIRDQSCFRNVINRIIGVSVVHIMSNDKSHPNLFLKLAKLEADQVMDFLKVHSTRSIVDYQLTRDLKGQGKKKMLQVDEGSEGSDQ